MRFQNARGVPAAFLCIFGTFPIAGPALNSRRVLGRCEQMDDASLPALPLLFLKWKSHAMNRNHFFLLGLVILFSGIQLRMVESFVLNDQATAWVAARTDDAQTTPGEMFVRAFPSLAPEQKRTITPAPWVGWAVLSAGAVLVLHSLAMPKAA